MVTQELVAAFETELLDNRADFAVAALVVYEHLFTLKYEVDFLFRRKWNASTWIFVFNRYFLLARTIFISAPAIQQICANSQAMNTLYFVTIGELSSIPSLAFTVLRVFAIVREYWWRRITVCILASLACVGFALDSYSEFRQVWVYVNDPVLGSSCFASIPPGAVGIVNRATQTDASIDGQLSDAVIAATVIIAIVLNALAFIITVAKTASQVQPSSVGLGTTLSQVLLRDGSMFFLAEMILSIVDFIATFNLDSLLNGPIGSIVVPIISIISRIVLSRFIINLRQVDAPTMNSSSDQHVSRFSTVKFRIPTSDEVIGNLGEPLEFVDYCVGDEDDGPDGSAEADVSVNLDMDMEGQGEGAEGMFGTGRGSSGSVRESVAAYEQVIDVQLEELRLSPVPSV